MMKISQIPSQKIIPIRFRFVKLPVVWNVLTGARWEQYRVAKLRAEVAGRGRELTKDEIAYFARRIPAAPLLCGRLRRIQAVDSEVLSEITDIRGIWDEFFRLPEGDLTKLAAFLNKVGAWPSSGDPSQSTPGHALKFPVIVQPSAVWDFRDDLRDGLLDRNRQRFKEAIAPVLSKPQTWLDLFPHQPANDFPLRFELSGVVAGVVTLTNTRHMLFATALADVAHDIRFKLCAREGCGVPFPITSEHVKKFHSAKCGHLALVQKGREEEKKKRRAEKRRTRAFSLLL
jgi:hypothetical protein